MNIHVAPREDTQRLGRPLLLILLLGSGGPALGGQIYDELKGQFAATLVITDEKVRQPVQSARRGTQLVAFVKLIGCAADASGRCNAETEYRIYRPDGALDGRSASDEPWREKAPAPGEAVVAAPLLGFRMSPQDPVGRYRIEATVKDRVSGNRVDLSQYVEITK
jgi:hypothetical protein